MENIYNESLTPMLQFCDWNYGLIYIFFVKSVVFSVFRRSQWVIIKEVVVRKVLGGYQGRYFEAECARERGALKTGFV